MAVRSAATGKRAAIALHCVVALHCVSLVANSPSNFLGLRALFIYSILDHLDHHQPPSYNQQDDLACPPQALQSAWRLYRLYHRAIE